MGMLFDNMNNAPPADVSSGGASSRTVSVAVNANLWRAFDYRWPESLGVWQVGQRVIVPFGRGDRKQTGFVVGIGQGDGQGRRLKSVLEVVDAQSQFDDKLWELAGWLSKYYLTPQGMTLAAMIPSAVGKHADREESVVFLTADRSDWPKNLGPRQKQVLDELLEAKRQGVEPLTMESLLHHSRAGRQSIAKLQDRSLVRIERREVRLPDISQAEHGDDFKLSDEQAAAMSQIESRLETGFSVTLLHGVTGSGKTEVYVRAIRQVVHAGKQAILLVPEIALAAQTLQRLLKRLPRVAVLHSGLTGVQRAFYYQQIRDGHASVVVGPRSAIFAPTRQLGLVIVDEEHESGYKQDTAPRYHGRDVAVMRASISGVPVILGSATPSLESMHNAQAGRYQLVRLPHRVRGLPMPKLQIVNLRHEMQEGRIELIGKTLARCIAAAIDRKEQIILLMNRRGYASYVFCPSCRDWVLKCESCDRPMVYHQATRMAMCHHCDHTAQLPEYCPACKKKLLLFGYGIQRVEGELSRKFPTARFARMDSDTMTSPAQFQKVFNEFASGDIDILLGTQMVAKGLDFPRVSLVGIVSADTSLAIPDFRADERTFQLIVQVAGRAGRADLTGLVIVQTLYGDSALMEFASRHDYNGFAANELPLRNQMHLPPFGRMMRFIVRHEKVDKAQADAGVLAERLRKMFGVDVKLQGPQPCGVIKLRDQFRFNILASFGRAGAIQQILFPRMEQLSDGIDSEIVIDVDPLNLM